MVSVSKSSIAPEAAVQMQASRRPAWPNIRSMASPEVMSTRMSPLFLPAVMTSCVAVSRATTREPRVPAPPTTRIFMAMG